MKLQKAIINITNKNVLLLPLVQKYKLAILQSGYLKKKYYLVSQTEVETLLSKECYEKVKKLKSFSFATGTLDDINNWIAYAESINLLANRGY